MIADWDAGVQARDRHHPIPGSYHTEDTTLIITTANRILTGSKAWAQLMVLA